MRDVKGPTAKWSSDGSSAEYLSSPAINQKRFMHAIKVLHFFTSHFSFTFSLPHTHDITKHIYTPVSGGIHVAKMNSFPPRCGRNIRISHHRRSSGIMKFTVIIITPLASPWLFSRTKKKRSYVYVYPMRCQCSVASGLRHCRKINNNKSKQKKKRKNDRRSLGRSTDTQYDDTVFFSFSMCNFILVFIAFPFRRKMKRKLCASNARHIKYRTINIPATCRISIGMHGYGYLVCIGIGSLCKVTTTMTKNKLNKKKLTVADYTTHTPNGIAQEKQTKNGLEYNGLFVMASNVIGNSRASHLIKYTFIWIFVSPSP